MPTRRAWAIVILALALYILANQTQIGWVYIMSNSLIGVLLVTWFYGLGTLKSIDVQRVVRNLSPHPSVIAMPTDHSHGEQGSAGSFEDQLFPEPTDYYEDDPVEVTLQFNHRRLRPAFLIGGQERCPFAPQADRYQSFFVPSLFRGRPTRLSYQTVCNRRGHYLFSKLRLRSTGPFGLFAAHRSVDVPDDILIYPKYYPLKRMRLLENRGLADKQIARIGASSEVVGTREYRLGDSLRQIHWRSTARVGKLVVKEFLDNDQLTVTVVLDLSAQSTSDDGKEAAFETAVRLAASFGYFASHQKIPFRLVGYSQRWKPPATALSWWGTLNYLSRVEPDGQLSLAEVLSRLTLQPFVVVLVSQPEANIERELLSLQRKGVQTLAILITPPGRVPAMSLSPGSSGLEIRTVSPANWTAVLAEV